MWIESEILTNKKNDSYASCDRIVEGVHRELYTMHRYDSITDT